MFFDSDPNHSKTVSRKNFGRYFSEYFVYLAFSDYSKQNLLDFRRTPQWAYLNANFTIFTHDSNPLSKTLVKIFIFGHQNLCFNISGQPDLFENTGLGRL